MTAADWLAAGVQPSDRGGARVRTSGAGGGGGEREPRARKGAGAPLSEAESV